MSDLNKIIAGSKSIEALLTQKFGATGRGMSEKLDSVRYPIPPLLRKHIRHLSWLRNRCVHESGFVLSDSDGYLAQCAAVCRELDRIHASHNSKLASGNSRPTSTLADLSRQMKEQRKHRPYNPVSNTKLAIFWFIFCVLLYSCVSTGHS